VTTISASIETRIQICSVAYGFSFADFSYYYTELSIFEMHMFLCNLCIHKRNLLSFYTFQSKVNILRNNVICRYGTFVIRNSVYRSNKTVADNVR